MAPTETPSIVSMLHRVSLLKSDGWSSTPFRYRDPLTGKWVRARYVAERHEIAARYAEWEITGPPEVREVTGGQYFRPYSPVLAEPPTSVQSDPALDRDERYLVLLFLRRYVRHCARARGFARMEGAARSFVACATALGRRSGQASTPGNKVHPQRGTASGVSR